MTTPNPQNIAIPAIACSLQGGYLIEASAGTGKTWTLTGILLRLLIEKRYPPERIIATTFTRDASQEIQERLQRRLYEFYQYLQWLVSKRVAHDNGEQGDKDWFLVGFKYRFDEVVKDIIEHAKEAGVPSHDDPIHLFLIERLLSDTDTSALDKAMRQVSLLLTTLDKLFVGTLDSLAQKLLREFASEISYHTDTVLISEDESEQQIRSLIHDELRHQHSVVASMPRVAQFLPTSLFSDVDGAWRAVKLSLQFYQADIDEWRVDVADVLAVFDGFVAGLLALDWSVFEPYCDFENAKRLGFSASLRLTKHFYCLLNIIEKIRQNPTTFYETLSDIENQWLSDCHHEKLAGLFKKGFEAQQSDFLSLPIDKIVQLNHWVAQLKQLTQDYTSHLYREMANKVRWQFKRQLEIQKQSTFTFQMVRLNEALQNNPSLCRQICHLYPVALIDESQDINGLQLTLLRHIYLNHLNDNKRGFLLFVGDPKQAIYRFRGGDVANYNFVKHYQHHQTTLLNQSLQLTQNRRSHQAMIESLNVWFLDNGKTNHHNPAYFGDGIYYQPIQAVKENSTLSWHNQTHQYGYVGNHAVSVLHFTHEQKDKSVQSIAWHINTLLQHHQREGRAIVPSDIAILASKNDHLATIKQALNELGIPAILAKSMNIFHTPSAHDIYVLLSAIMDTSPTQVGRLLTSRLFDLSLDDVMAMMTQSKQSYIDVIGYLNTAKDKWYRYGVMSCLYHALLNNPLKSNHSNQYDTLWQQCAKQGERYLADLWQLLEIVGNKSKSYHHHELKLLAWYAQMMTQPTDKDEYKQRPLPSESGVQLFTMHASKGLEFSIAYVFDLDKALAGSSALFYPYSDEHFIRRISPSNHKKIMASHEDDLDFYKKNDQREQIDERLRLGYVALTRASEQLFVVAVDADKKTALVERPLYLWFDNLDKATLSLPERLKHHVDWINIADNEELCQTPYQAHQTQNERVDYADWAEVFKQEDFYGKHRTSASALMNQLDKPTQLSQDSHQEDEDWQLPILPVDVISHSAMSYGPDDIRCNFEKGTNAGTFLHWILQTIDEDMQISTIINQAVKKMGFANAYLKHEGINEHHDKLWAWIHDIINTPMSSQVSLHDLLMNNSQRAVLMREMSFTLGVHESFSIEGLNDILTQYDERFADVLQIDKREYDYLNGEIDLVYEHEGKFYIVDYKSNFVSRELSDYQPNILEPFMAKAGYWLQACIYQVALHRLLSLRIHDYVGNEQRYLGGVEFIFLRGVDNNYPALGRVSWQIPTELIVAMDELLGKEGGGA